MCSLPPAHSAETEPFTSVSWAGLCFWGWARVSEPPLTICQHHHCLTRPGSTWKRVSKLPGGKCRMKVALTRTHVLGTMWLMTLPAFPVFIPLKKEIIDDTC